MATSDLKVDELRAKLAQRGLSTAGIKPTLVILLCSAHLFILLVETINIDFKYIWFLNLQVRRLEASIRDESRKSQDSGGDPQSSRKRQRDSDATDADSEAPRKIKAVEELQSMNVKQLREEASIRGVSAAGTKKELLERLCADDSNASKADDEGN